jgi:2-polyprenyl-3-methyl-5-hydroxy-6-metoxy-1,4-benzoquinol methylase
MIERFNKEAKEWDKLKRRRLNAQNIANTIKSSIALNNTMSIADFGAGTGLLSQFLEQDVAKITAIDNSKNMLNEFKNKNFRCQIDTLYIDILKENSFNIEFNGIVSSMTMHHIDNIEKLFQKFYSILKQNGFIALADLNKEDGTFHSSNDGVFHFGFDFNKLKDIAIKVGFKNIEIKSCNKIEKPHKDFEVLAIIAYKI